MTETEQFCWQETVRVCMEGADEGRLAEHLAQLPHDHRATLLDGIGSERLRARVDRVLRRRRDQLALV